MCCRLRRWSSVWASRHSCVKILPGHLGRANLIRNGNILALEGSRRAVEVAIACDGVEDNNERCSDDEGERP
jgi:hypothetical protein